MPAQTLPGANGCMPPNGVLGGGAIRPGSEGDYGKDDPGAADGGGKSEAGATVFFPEVWCTFPIVVHVLGSPLTTPPRGEVVFHSETIRNFPVWLCNDERARAWQLCHANIVLDVLAARARFVCAELRKMVRTAGLEPA